MAITARAGVLSGLLAMTLAHAPADAVRAHPRESAAASRPTSTTETPGQPRRPLRGHRYDARALRIPQLPSTAKWHGRDVAGPPAPRVCAAAERAGLHCRATPRDAASADLAGVVIESPGPRTRGTLEPHGIPAIDNVPPIVIINPDRRRQR